MSTIFSMKLPISVFIIAQDEADRIATTIRSVIAWVDEVIVVDSGSTDGTQALAESLGARVLAHAWEGYGLQKRFGEEQCRNHWLLNLDADEEITPQLAAEIQALFAFGEPPMGGYIVNVRDLLPGEQHIALMAHTNHCLRLYDKRQGRFSDSPVHDSVIMEPGKVGRLRAPLLHRSFRGLVHAISKMNGYTTSQAELMLRKKNPTYLKFRLFIELPYAFIKVYVLRLYILRGCMGFIFAVNYAFGRFSRVAKYLELRENARRQD